jgi:pyruvate dehydrogenase E2 component (dihydrolipoamide acetyltransferase)/2-oxoglutarate dehydrogenase E2 component (dihydrolipoamide succinyltransferase)
MAAFIAIPKLGMTMTEATLVEWKAKEGGHVEKGDIVLAIQTEKIKWDVEASASGYVHILAEVDVTAPVGRVVGLIAETAEELEALQREPAKELFTTVPGAATGPAVAAAPAPGGRAERPEGIRISPLARKLAEEHGIDVSTVAGSGPGGRIVRDDIERAIAARAHAPAAEAYEGKTVKTTIPLKGMRKVIAEHMQRSLAVAAQLTMMGELDMSEVTKLRQTLLDEEQDGGVRVTYTDILVVAIARALQDHPIMNSSLIENEIVVWQDISVGVAVALEEGLEGGLIVPVIRNADQKSLHKVSLEARTLVEKARAGRLLPDDVSGGTFTLTNLGAVGGGWGFGTPIINQPQSAILGAGSISDRPVVRDGQIVVRPIMTYSLTFDHRVIDGAAAAQFMARVTQLLEDPRLLTPP